MNKGDRKLILVLLIIIIILSCVLIFKIKSEPEYDEKLYSKIYAEYDELFENTLEETKNDDVTTTSNSDSNSNYIEHSIQTNTTSSKEIVGRKNSNIIGKIIIPKLSIRYPVINETTDEYLKIAPTRLFGPDANEVGNLCIIGHNMKNEKFFSKLSDLEAGDKVFLTSNNGKEMTYYVYDKYEINDNDMSCTSQETNGKIELTLITCTSKKNKRLVVKCRTDRA